MNLIVLDQKGVLFPEQDFTVWVLPITGKRLKKILRYLG